jgi:acyl-CoA synthetase (AMP-forming)/AMP-acid ligase II
MQGYWQKEKETQDVFIKNIQNCDNDIFLRTGDLGFIFEGEVYITGRLKDLIIIRGANYYPQDIEQQVEKCHTALSAAGSAAFSVEQDGQEKLVIVQEIERTYLHRLEPEKVFSAIRRSVSEHFYLDVYSIVLIKPCSLPKTTSGKVQRQNCKQMFLKNELSKVPNGGKHM